MHYAVNKERGERSIADDKENDEHARGGEPQHDARPGVGKKDSEQHWKDKNIGADIEMHQIVDTEQVSAEAKKRPQEQAFDDALPPYLASDALKQMREKGTVDHHAGHQYSNSR